MFDDITGVEKINRFNTGLQLLVTYNRALLLSLGDPSLVKPAAQAIAEWNLLLRTRSGATNALTTQETASLLGCTSRHVRRLARQAKIQGRIGPLGAWHCTADSVYAYSVYRRHR
jgi:hypothetical protein